MKDAEEWIAKQKWISEMKIANLEKAIANIGTEQNMQHIRISSMVGWGMGRAMSGGDYIDISEEPLAHQAITEVLWKILEREKQHLKTITNE